MHLLAIRIRGKLTTNFDPRLGSRHAVKYDLVEGCELVTVERYGRTVTEIKHPSCKGTISLHKAIRRGLAKKA